MLASGVRRRCKQVQALLCPVCRRASPAIEADPSFFLGLFGIAFLAFAMAFERDKRNNPAERSGTDARLGVARVVQLEEMNWGPAIPKSELGAAFAMRFRATVSRRNKQGLRAARSAQSAVPCRHLHIRSNRKGRPGVRCPLLAATDSGAAWTDDLLG